MSSQKVLSQCERIHQILEVMDYLHRIGCVPCYYGGVSQVEYEIMTLSLALNGRAQDGSFSSNVVESKEEEKFVRLVDEWIKDMAA